LSHKFSKHGFHIKIKIVEFEGVKFACTKVTP